MARQQRRDNEPSVLARIIPPRKLSFCVSSSLFPANKDEEMGGHLHPPCASISPKEMSSWFELCTEQIAWGEEEEMWIFLGKVFEHRFELSVGRKKGETAPSVVREETPFLFSGPFCS